MTAIADLKPFLKNINCRFIVVKKVEEGKAAKEGGFVYTFQVADETGTVITTLWNEVGQSTKVGDIILMVGGFVTMFKNTIRIACKLGTLIRLGSFQLIFSDSVNVSKDIWLPDPANPKELVKQPETPAKRKRIMKS